MSNSSWFAPDLPSVSAESLTSLKTHQWGQNKRAGPNSMPAPGTVQILEALGVHWWTGFPFLRYLVVSCLISFRPATLTTGHNQPKSQQDTTREDFTSVEIALARKENFLKHNQGDKSWVIPRNMGMAALMGSSSMRLTGFQQRITYTHIISQVGYWHSEEWRHSMARSGLEGSSDRHPVHTNSAKYHKHTKISLEVS